MINNKYTLMGLSALALVTSVALGSAALVTPTRDINRAELMPGPGTDTTISINQDEAEPWDDVGYEENAGSADPVGTPVSSFTIPRSPASQEITIHGLEDISSIGDWQFDDNEDNVDVSGVIHAEFFNESAYMLVETSAQELTPVIEEMFANIFTVDLIDLVPSGTGEIEYTWTNESNQKRVDVLAGEEETLVVIRSVGATSVQNYSIVLAVNTVNPISQEPEKLLEIGKTIELVR